MSEIIAELREQVSSLTEELERIATEAALPATVLSLEGDNLKLATPSGHVVVQAPRDTKLAGGDNILVHRQTLAYIRDNPFPGEETIATVVDVQDEEFAVIDVQGQQRLVPITVDDKVRPGDEVRLDEYLSFIRRVVPKRQAYAVSESTVCWADIGGNDEAKNALIEAIELPYKHPELFKQYGASPAKGILLYGPPGCGKTMLGKAVANSMGAADGFILCKGPEVLNEYVGVSERTVRGLFERARMFHRETGKKAVIFIDEAEAILTNRGERNNYMGQTIVPTFLAEMDGVEESCATVILATNRSQTLDGAVVREGRVDRKVKVARPNATESHAILSTYLRKTPLTVALDALAEKTVLALWERRFSHPTGDQEMHRFVSGAMIAGIVEKAKAHAMRRDLASGKFTGVGHDDMEYALAQTALEMGSTTLDHHE